MAEYDFDVGIIGGGPAGASCAAYLAKAGLKVVVLEGELFPRPHVGESLVPATTRVFKELGFLDKMHEANFPKKYGAAWTAHDKAPVYQTKWEGLEPEVDVRIQFAERDQAGVDLNYTFHVDRGKFDNLLLQHANELGATVYEGVRAKNVEFNGGAKINFEMGKKEFGLNTRLVVDASGRRTLLGNQLKLKIKDRVFDQYALHAWFEDFDRSAAAVRKDQTDYIFIHFLPITNTWVWQIPITDRVTSIGVVTQKKFFSASRQERVDFFWECLKSRPEIYEAVKASKQVTPLREEGDYSYAMTQIAGDNFVLIGDAARFVDPIFSTGVSIALSCSRFSAPDIIRAVETGNCKAEAFNNYQETMRRGTRNWYEFISVYYRLNVLFTAFISDKRYRLDVLKLLQGDVYDEAQPEVLNKMKEIVREVESNPDHLWHSALGNLASETLRTTF